MALATFNYSVNGMLYYTYKLNNNNNNLILSYDCHKCVKGITFFNLLLGQIC